MCSHYFFRDKKNIWEWDYWELTFFLLALLFSSSCVTHSVVLLFLLSLYLSFAFLHVHSLLSLLILLVYLGSLLVLFCYIWMFIIEFVSYSSSLLILYLVLLALSNPINSFSASSSMFLYPSGLLLFLITFIFWAVIVVVLVLDLSMGGSV
jgi:hypothetical protein